MLFLNEVTIDKDRVPNRKEDNLENSTNDFPDPYWEFFFGNRFEIIFFTKEIVGLFLTINNMLTIFVTT